jgi:hypothetical protein
MRPQWNEPPPAGTAGIPARTRASAREIDFPLVAGLGALRHLECHRYLIYSRLSTLIAGRDACAPRRRFPSFSIYTLLAVATCCIPWTSAELTGPSLSILPIT